MGRVKARSEAELMALITGVEVTSIPTLNTKPRSAAPSITKKPPSRNVQRAPAPETIDNVLAAFDITPGQAATIREYYYVHHFSVADIARHGVHLSPDVIWQVIHATTHDQAAKTLDASNALTINISA